MKKEDDKNPMKCQLCTSWMDPGEGDNIELRICAECQKHPDGKKLLAAAKPSAPVKAQAAVKPTTSPAAAVPSKPATAAPQVISREFTLADKSMIKKLHGFMPVQQLLDLLNDRLAADLGDRAKPYTIEQLYAEIGDKASAAPAAANDWPSLRKLIAAAKRAGTLQLVTEQLVDDFAVVFSLNPRQVLSLKDILLTEGRE